MQGKKILVAGLGKSGIAAFEALGKEGAALAVYDDRVLNRRIPTTRNAAATMLPMATQG
jgi:UDP-N-acetylmuramoylalanine-D-glutamate ligase